MPSCSDISRIVCSESGREVGCWEGGGWEGEREEVRARASRESSALTHEQTPLSGFAFCLKPHHRTSFAEVRCLAQPVMQYMFGDMHTSGVNTGDAPGRQCMGRGRGDGTVGS